MIKAKRIIMFIIIALLLFQDSIQRVVEWNFIDFFDELIVVILTIIALFRVFKTQKVSRSILILFLLMILFFASGTISLFLNSSHTFSRFLESAFLAIKCFLLIIDIGIIGFKEDTKIAFLEIMNEIGVICVIIGIFNFFFPSIYARLFPFAIISYRFGFVSVTSLFYHPGRFGWFMLFLSLMNYSVYNKNKLKNNKILFIIFGFFSLLPLRTKVIVSMIVFLAFSIILSKKIEVKKIITVSLVGLIVFISFNKVIMTTYYTYFDDNTTAITARQSITKNSYKIMKEYFPLGVGFGKYGSWYARKYYSEYYFKYNMTGVYGLAPGGAFFATDTFWGSIFGETGVIGSIFYILFLVYVYTILKKGLNNKKNITVLFGILVLIQSIVESFGEQSFNSPPQYIFLAFVVGAAINESIKMKNEG